VSAARAVLGGLGISAPAMAAPGRDGVEFLFLV
jgi:hypothetical protein